MRQTADIDTKHLGSVAKLDGPLSQRVYVLLRECITDLRFRPGALLRKSEICEHLGVSRSPVSEAIARLASEGLVDVVPQSGSRVSYLSMPEIREGAFLRSALELAAVAKVATEHREEQLMKLNRNLRMQSILVEDGDTAGFFEADKAFHALIMQFTGFDRMAELAMSVSSQVERARMLLLPSPGRIADTLAEHERVVAAIGNRDANGARDAMEQHLGQLMHRIVVLADERPDLFDPLSKSHRNLA